MQIDFDFPTAAPIDGSEGLLRRLSPFIIQVEPPLAFANSPSVLDQNNPTGKAASGLFGPGLRARDGFVNARSALANSTFVQGNLGSAGPAEEVVARNSPSSSGGTTRRQGTKSTDASGKIVTGRVGEPAIADVLTAVDITAQVRSSLSVPPLVLLINPQSLSIAYTKIQQFSDRTRFGYVYHAWGEEQPKLSIEVKCGAFISGGRGVQWASRRDSAAWQNLMNAFRFYRNNGYLYDTVNGSQAHHFVGALSIRYDQWVYYGHMQSFNFEFNDNSVVHGGITVSMEFVVSAMSDTAPVTLNVTPMKRIVGAAMAASSNIQDPTFNRPGETSRVPTAALPSTGTARNPAGGTPPTVTTPKAGPPPTSLPTGGRGFKPTPTPTAAPTATLAAPGRSERFEVA
jgi:hypothetical protein